MSVVWFFDNFHGVENLVTSGRRSQSVSHGWLRNLNWLFAGPTSLTSLLATVYSLL